MDNQCYISHTKRFIYFPIQKAACSSLKLALSPYFGISLETNTAIKKNIFDDLDYFEKIHAQPFPYVSRKQISEGSFNKYYKFAFVRNPWDRVFSFYKNKILKTDLTNRYFLNGIPRFLVRDYGTNLFKYGMGFEKFINIIAEIPDRDAEQHFRSQHKFITYNKRCLANFVGKIENMEKDYQYVCDHAGIVAKLDKINSTIATTGGYRDFYNKKTIKIIRERYEEDILQFQYEF
ncbi:MAG: sulfotransferase family 2 domain-containing protein [Pelagibacterales bacterium]|nr:sulfotransferase family 2 domain-containing protein [Pelagibacterales bacterium]